jgi:D-beta-D-heptose 7-phosphate kinase / D-beta-D-heptose 1-phosphate adenosyltransferase
MPSGKQSPATPQELVRTLDKIAALNLLCVGDIMLDRYIYGNIDRISPEAPIPVFTANREERMLGGAGNVVRNLLSLGAHVAFASVIGDDTTGTHLTALVGTEKHLVPTLLTERGRISTKKTRYVASSQQILRSDNETREAVRPETISKITELLLPEISEYHAVILSDYGKGLLTPELCRSIIDTAKKHDVPVFVDPKQRDVSIYAGATVLSPNLKELALAAGVDHFENDAAIIAAAQHLATTHRFQYVLVTRGEHGMSLIDAAGLVLHLPAAAQQVFDVSGAGDTVIATLAATYAAGATMAHAATLANLAGGIVVGRLGTAVVHRSDLTAALYMQRARALQEKVLPLETACDIIANWRREGLTIGFTNGCFDIMHAGHITLLTDAKSRCDELIVALNTDASVRALKGPSRPVNAEMDRAQVVAALGVVDAVVLFNEDTPLELLAQLKPDVLMKGADYTKDQVVGAQLVESYGGRVELLALKDGYSTSEIIRKVVG